MHVLVVVGDVEDGDLFAAEGFAVFPVEAFAVDGFHDDDEVGPVELFGGKGDDGVVVEACGVDVDTGVIGEDGFGGGAAETIHRADKEAIHGMFG